MLSHSCTAALATPSHRRRHEGDGRQAPIIETAPVLVVTVACMRGRWIPLSLPRRLVSDLLAFASKIPILPVQRQMHLGPLQAARDAASARPAWIALFIKGFALAAEDLPELRRVYLKFPWPHLYEYPDSVAAITIERPIGDEPAVLVIRLDAPARVPVGEIDAAIRHARSAPVGEVKEFRRALLLACLPLVLRRLLMWLPPQLARDSAAFFRDFCGTGLVP